MQRLVGNHHYNSFLLFILSFPFLSFPFLSFPFLRSFLSYIFISIIIICLTRYSLKDGFYFGVSQTEPLVNLDVSLLVRTVNAVGKLFFLELDITSREGFSGDPLSLSFGANIEVVPVTNNRLTLALIKARRQSLFSLNFFVRADINLQLTVGTVVDGLPKVSTGLVVEFVLNKGFQGAAPATGSTTTTTTTTAAPSLLDNLSVRFVNAYIDLGDTVNRVLGPILKKVNEQFEPVDQVLGPLLEPLPVVSMMAKQDVSVLTVVAILGRAPPKVLESLNKFLNMLRVVRSAAQELAQSESLRLPLTNGCGSSNWELDLKNGRGLVPYCQTVTRRSDALDVFRRMTRRTSHQCGSGGSSSKFRSILQKLCENGFTFPLLDSPSDAMGLLTGKVLTLVRFDSPVLQFSATFRKDFPLPPFPPVSIFFEAFVSVSLRVSAVYDTSGIQKAIAQRNPLLAFDGFGIVTLNDDGTPYQQLTLSGYLTVGAEFNAGIAKAGAGGRFGFTAGLSLLDPSGDDGLLRISELITVFRVKGVGGFKFLFRIDVGLSVGVDIYVKVFALFGYSTVFREGWNFPIFSWAFVPDLVLKIANQEGGVLKLRFDNAANWITGSNFALKVSHVSGCGGNEKITVSVAPIEDINLGAAGDLNSLIEFTFEGVSQIVGTAEHIVSKDVLLILKGVLSETVVTGGFAGPARRQHEILLDYSDVDGGLAGTLEPAAITPTNNRDDSVLVFSGAVRGRGVVMTAFARVALVLSADDDSLVIQGCPINTDLAIDMNLGVDDLIMQAPAKLPALPQALDRVRCNLVVDGNLGENTLSIDFTSSLQPISAVFDVSELQVSGRTVQLDRFVQIEVQLPQPVIDTDQAQKSVFELINTPDHANSTFTISSPGRANVIVHAQGVQRSLALLTTKTDQLTFRAGSSQGALSDTALSGFGLPLGNLSLGGVGSLELGLTSDDDEFVVTGNSRLLTILAGAGDDTIEVHGTGLTSSIRVNMGPDDDTVTVYGDSGSMLGLLLVEGGGEASAGGDRCTVYFNAASSINVAVLDMHLTMLAQHNTSGSYLFARDLRTVTLSPVLSAGLDQTALTRHTGPNTLERISFNSVAVLSTGHFPDLPHEVLVEYTSSGATLTIQGSANAADVVRVGLFGSVQADTYARVTGLLLGGSESGETAWLSQGNGAPLTIDTQGGDDTVIINANLGTVDARGGGDDGDQLWLRSYTNTLQVDACTLPSSGFRAVVLEHDALCWFGHGRVTYQGFAVHSLRFRKRYGTQALMDIESTQALSHTSVQVSGNFVVHALTELLDGTVVLAGGGAEVEYSDHMQLSAQWVSSGGTATELRASQRAQLLADEMQIEGMGLPNDHLYLTLFGELELELSDLPDNVTMDVDYTAVDGWRLETYILGRAGDDRFALRGTPAHSVLTTLEGGAGADDFELFAAGVEGGEAQRFFGRVVVDGEGDRDQIECHLAGTGFADIAVVDSSITPSQPVALDVLTINGVDGLNDQFLLRLGNVSLLHLEEGTAEFVAVDSLEAVHVRGLGGDDQFGVDTTEQAFTLWGGSGNDQFVIGQMFNSRRDAVAGLSTDEAARVRTARTTRGFLSRGNLRSMVIHGEDGDDKFYVQHNGDVLSLHGEAGNDFFSVRAFVLQLEPGDSSFDRNQTELLGEHGDDYVQYDESAPVEVDGGSGFNTLVVIGTEFDDIFIIHETGIYGAGLFIQAINIQRLVVSTQEGDDKVYVLSTAPQTAMGAVGDLGSDTFFIAPRETEPVVSQTLRGHAGVVNHKVVTTDADYADVIVPGVQAFVTDDDEFGISIKVVREAELGNTLVFDAEDNGLDASYGALTYEIALSREPSGTEVIIKLDIPAIFDANDEPADLLAVQQTKYVDAFSKSVTIPAEEWMTPVTVTVVPNTQPGTPLDGLKPGEQFASVKHSFVTGHAFNNSLPPVAVRSLFPDQPGIYVANPGAKLEVLEGAYGFIEYELLQFPCTPSNATSVIELMYDRTVLVLDPPDQVAFDANVAGGCRQTVRVRAFDDTLEQVKIERVTSNNVF